ncbi:protein wnt, partial [Plakobranchus ocellatus]
ALYRSANRPWTTTRNCSKSSGLISRQLRICRDNLDLMPSVVTSTLVGMETCQNQFKDRRWNCSSVLAVPNLNNDLVRGTREQAYVYGISSAALVHTLSRACSIGVTTKCSCGPLPTWETAEDFKWGGCGDDVKFGLQFAELFTKATLINKKGKEKQSKKAMMNRHNFRVGREIVKASLGKACKCHGVSGSCAQKTCWKALPNFDAIGAMLRERYALAVEVRRKRKKKIKMLVPKRRGRSQFRNDELVYYERSPDYCSPDVKTGSVGTKGRQCILGSRGARNCESMCCGRGHETYTEILRERCECKYFWCCYVKCKTCTKVLKLNKCR